MLVEQKLKEARNSGFTLIELLVVTVVIVALMGVIFRLTGIAGGTSAKETTVFRMQCLENCLSGYYAAFGSYPPVPLQNEFHTTTIRKNMDKMDIVIEGLGWASVSGQISTITVKAPKGVNITFRKAML